MSTIVNPTASLPEGGSTIREAEELSPFLNRELSWLEFNARVLAEAADPTVPLLDRLKFLAIFGGNLDEFFMKRVGGLKLQQQSNPNGLSPDGRTPAQQLAEIGAWVRPRQQQQRALLLEKVLPEIARHGVELVTFRDLAPAERAHIEKFFSSFVFPILTPLGLDTSHPFPFISNLSLSLAVALRSPASAEVRFARLKVPPSLPRWIQLPESLRFIPLEVVIAEFLERLFPGMELLESYPFRVTRAADVAKHEEQAEDLLESVQEDLRARRFASVVRLEVVPEMPEWMRLLLADELVVGPADVYEVRPPLAARDLFQLAALNLPALQEPKWRPQTHPRLESAGEPREVDLFRVIRSGDLLVHHPYDAFSSSVERFLRIAAEDPAVLAIKQTLYRTSRNSPVVQSLIEAAERGKQVAVLVELKASFDEARNIEWAEALEGAGAHVAYGVLGYKTHAKVSLVVRQEPDGTAHLRPSRDRQLQHRHRRALHRPRALQLRSRARRRHRPALQPADFGAYRRPAIREAGSGADEHAPAGARAHRARGRASEPRRAGPDHRQDELARGSPDRAGALRRLARRRGDRPHRARRLPAAAGSPRDERDHPRALDRRTIPRARAASSTSPTPAPRSTSSPPPTGCRGTSTTGWRRWCRSSRPTCAPSCRASWTCSSPTTARPGCCNPMAAGASSGQRPASRSATVRRSSWRTRSAAARASRRLAGRSR